MSSNNEIPVGQRFSHVYLAKTTATSDSERARTRLLAHCADLSPLVVDHVIELVVKELGLNPRGHSSYQQVKSIFDGGRIEDVLDLITLAYQSAVRKGYVTKGNAWRSAVERVFREEALAYRVDEKCGIHPLVDQEFDHNRQATVRGLERQGLKSAKLSLEKAYDLLGKTEHDNLEAVRSMFDALENVFKNAFGTSRLGSKEISTHLSPLINANFTGRAKDAAHQLATSFGNYVNAAHQYRHADGETESTPPSLEIAVAFLALGSSFLRLVLDLAEQRPPDQTAATRGI